MCILLLFLGFIFVLPFCFLFLPFVLIFGFINFIFNCLCGGCGNCRNNCGNGNCKRF